MAIIHAQITFQGESGSPDDQYVNNLYFLTADTAEATLDDIFDLRIEPFYKDIPSIASASISGYFSASVAQNGHQVKFYEQSAAPPRLPLHTRTFNLTADPTAAGYPEEVALCLSFHGTPVAGTNVGPGPHLPARHRGRIYLGPLANIAGAQVGAAVRPVSGVNLAWTGAAAEFLLDDAVDPGSSWCVYSPTDDAGYIVIGGHVDNAFDIIRGRGAAPTARVLFP